MNEENLKKLNDLNFLENIQIKKLSIEIKNSCSKTNLIAITYRNQKNIMLDQTNVSFLQIKFLQIKNYLLFLGNLIFQISYL